MSINAASVPHKVDIIVVGGGGAGLAAAIEAAAAMHNVLLIEKEPKLGGTTARSVGSITASATDLQREAGIVDSPSQHFEDMPLFAGALAARDNLDLRRLLTENSPSTVAWLERLGVVFFGPMPEPPHRVPRMHNVLPNSKAYTYHLGREARRLGVHILVNARAQKLIMNGGRVTGVEVLINGRFTQIEASQVILASGDYSSGRELKEQHLPDSICHIEGINPASTGNGQRLGLQAGGARARDPLYSPAGEDTD